MKRFSNVLRIGSGMLALSVAAFAQGQGPYYPQRDDPNYRNYDSRSRGYNDGHSPQQRGYSGSLIDQVMSDLDRAAPNARLDGHERKHFDEAARKLQDFERRWAEGKFDTGKLDSAIENLQHLAKADRVRGRDREMLARDVQDLRQFRATRGRNFNGGYEGYRDGRYNQNPRYDPNSR